MQELLKVLISPILVRGSQLPVCPAQHVWGFGCCQCLQQMHSLSPDASLNLQHLPLLGDHFLLDEAVSASMF